MSETDAASPCQPRAEPEELPDQRGLVNAPSGASTFVDAAQNNAATLKPLEKNTVGEEMIKKTTKQNKSGTFGAALVSSAVVRLQRPRRLLSVCHNAE